MQFDGDGRLEVKAMNAGEKVLTVTPAEGESFDASKVYNLLVYPGTHTSLSVEITDIHGCTFTQEVRGNYEFVPANFYTFNFNTSYVKVYTFSVNSGLTVSAGTELAVVYKDATSVVQSETVAAGSDLKFTVNQIQQVVHGENIKGYAVWPAEAFDNNKINCWMDNTNGGKFGWGTEPTKVAVLGAEKVDFKDPVAAMGKITYTVPVGVTVVKISSDQPISGQREIVVAENGELTLPGTAGAKDVTNPLDEFYVYPISNATLTATLSDGTATVTKQFTGVSIAAGQTKNLDMSGVSFDKNGSFENEDFNDSDIVINFGE